MHSDKYVNFWNCKTLLPSACQCFCFLKSTAAFTLNSIENVLGVKINNEGWVRKIQFLTNLKTINCCKTSPDDKLIHFPTQPMQIAQALGQFKNSVFVIVGN